MVKLLGLHSGCTNRHLSHASFFRVSVVLRVKAVRKCVLNLHAE